MIVKDMEEFLKDDAFGAGITDKENTEVIDEVPDFVYSTDEEIFYDSIDDLDLEGFQEGEKVVIYKGIPQEITHMDFLKKFKLVEYLQQMAYDEDGEMAEDYLMDVSEDDELEILQEINRLLSEISSQPSYHRVVNIEPMTITIGEFD